MNKTKIEWALNPDGSPGYTSNPLTGCLNGCPYCYARRLASGRLKTHYTANKQIILPFTDQQKLEARVGHDFSMEPFFPRWWPNELEKVAAHKNPAGIFLCDMSDWLGDWIPVTWQWEIINYIKFCNWHRFYLLTKQYQNLAKYSPYPENTWVGATITDNNSYITAYHAFGEVVAMVRFYSVEPFLGRINCSSMGLENRVDWIIIGACTGTEKDLLKIEHEHTELKPMRWGKKWTLQPPVEWITELLETAAIADIPVFLKNSLTPLLESRNCRMDSLFWEDGQNATEELPTIDLHLRQEIPEYAMPSIPSFSINIVK